MENSSFNSIDFTLLASQKLTQFSQDAKLQSLVRQGDQQVINSIFEEILERPHTFGDFLKRYIADITYQNYDDISDEELEEFIKYAFAENQMKNIGSLTPGSSTALSQRLSTWLSSPITDISRQTIFLFCFGLNMDEDAASVLLTKTFRTYDFYVRDYKEVIYYYCLKHNLQYPGMLEWLDIYDKLPVDETETAHKSTSMLKDSFSPLQESFEMDKEQFKNYLSILKNLPSTKKKNRYSQHEQFKYLMAGVESVLYKKCSLENKRERLNTKRGQKLLDAWKDTEIDKYQRLLKSANCEHISTLLLTVPYNHIVIPENIKKLIDQGLIRFPSFSCSNLKKKLEDRRDPITRTDLLFGAFLLCTGGNDYSKIPPEKLPFVRRNDFEETVNTYLESCGYGKLYLLNPLELLLIFCLYQEHPFEYLIALWRYATSN